MDVVSTPSTEVIKMMVSKGATEGQVIAELMAQGIPESEAQEMIASWKKEKTARQQKNGLTLLVIGSIACFISCVLTIADVFPALNNFFLYGLTSMGVIVVFGGLVLVFE